MSHVHSSNRWKLLPTEVEPLLCVAGATARNAEAPPSFVDVVGQHEEAVTRQMQGITRGISSIVERVQQVRQGVEAGVGGGGRAVAGAGGRPRTSACTSPAGAGAASGAAAARLARAEVHDSAVAD